MNINELGEDLNMIDTVSRGIKKMFNEQWRRHFPMPDYEIDQVKKKVVVRIYGNEINKRYTDLLKTNDTLSLWDCISLDAVQKGRTIHDSLFYVKPTFPSPPSTPYYIYYPAHNNGVIYVSTTFVVCEMPCLCYCGYARKCVSLQCQ